MFFTFIIKVFIVEALANLIVNTYIFTSYRSWIQTLEQKTSKYTGDKLTYSVNCHLCTSTQIAFILNLSYLLSGNILSFIGISVLTGRTSYILHNIYEILPKINELIIVKMNDSTANKEPEDLYLET